jgi:hypothetical protein
VLRYSAEIVSPRVPLRQRHRSRTAEKSGHCLVVFAPTGRPLLPTVAAPKAKNQNSEVLSQEIGLTYIRLSMVEEKLQRQSQADQDMEHGQTELSAVGWKDVSKSHLKSLVTQLNSEYRKLDKKDKPISAAIAAP